MATHPYPGLRPFQPDEADIFFGRDDELTKILQKLDRNHFIAVLGDSGCGKSSLVHVGLVHQLHFGVFYGAYWLTAELRPGDTPFDNLARTLYADTQFSSCSSESDLSSQLCQESSSLFRLLKDNPLPENTNLLIVVDQFEELFRYSQQPGEVELFIHWLLASAEHDNVFIVITMRSEYLDKCAQYYEFANKINNGLYLVPPLSQEQLREIIATPMKMFGGAVEEALIERIIQDVSDKRQDQLPLIQHTLMSLCPLSSQKLKGYKLLLADYEKIGGIAGSISNTGNFILEELDESQRKIAEILFRNLTTYDKELNTFIRNPIKLLELAELSGVTWQAVAPVVDEFRGRRHRFLTPLLEQEDRLKADSVIDIGHESLIREWRQLRDWATQEYELVDFYRHRLMIVVEYWKRNKAELWLGANLETALEWQNDLSKIYVTDEQVHAWAKLQGGDFELAKQFLKASQEEKQRLKDQERELQKTQKERELELHREQERRIIAQQRVWIMASAVVLVVLFAGWAYIEKKNAIVARGQAEQSEIRRTNDLFNSQRIHAALLTRNEDFSAAKTLLEKTRELDNKLSYVIAPRHARNLLLGFTALMGGESLQDYPTTSELQSIAVSPTGDMFAVVGKQGFAAIFNTARKESMQRLESHTGIVRAVVFHPKKEWIATAGDDKKIILWDIDGKKIKEWSSPTEVYTLAVSKDGLLVSGGADNKIYLWNTETKESIHTFSGHTDVVLALNFDGTGERLASASADKTARIWKIATPNEQPIVLTDHTDHDDKVFDVAFSPDNNLLATAWKDSKIRLWNLTTAQVVRVVDGETVNTLNESGKTLDGHQGAVFGVSFLSNQQLVSCSADRTLRVWDVASGVTVRILQGHTSMVTDVAIPVQGDQIFSVNTRGAIKRWNAKLPNQYQLAFDSLEAQEKELSATALAPDGKMVAVGAASGSLRLYSLPDLQLLDEKPKIHHRDVQRINFSLDGQWLATASLDNRVILWKIKNNKLEEPFTFSHQKGVSAVAFSPDNKNLTSVSYDGSLMILRMDDRKTERYELVHNGGELNSVAFDTSGQKLLTASDHMIRLWNFDEFKNNQLPTNPLLETKVEDVDVLWAALSTDAKSYAVAGKNAVVRVYSVEKNQLLYDLVGHDTSVLRAAFSPDNKQLATVSGDATVRFWDLMDGSELFALRLPTNAGKPEPLWDFDFRCADEGQGQCWLAVPLTRGKLMLYDFGRAYQ